MYTKRSYGVKERINWIDWAKAMAVCTVVFCHLPQSQEWFYYRFLQATIITVFFWVSGYLKGIHEEKSHETTLNSQLSKYWHSLILPYLLYNAIVYPYWLLRYYMLNGGMPDLFHAMRPIIGALLLEHESAYAEPLNGPLWYLPAILIMHLLIDMCRKTRYMHHIMITLCIITYALNIANKQYELLTDLTSIGIIRRLPYYYLGYVMGQCKLLRHNQPKRDAVAMVCLLSLSLLAFEWHLHSENALLHITLFYPVNLGFLFAALYTCKLLNRFQSCIITNLSIGTLVIIGIHFPVIGIVNYVIAYVLNHQDTICYHWYTALPMTIFIVTLLYPVILFGKKHQTILLGKSNGANIQ